MNTKEKAIAEIDTLRIYPEFKVEKIDDSLWRINDKFDLYPDKRRIYVVSNTSKYWLWKAGKLIETIRDLSVRSTNPKMFDVVYVVGWNVVETISRNMNYGQSSMNRKNAISTGQYKNGIIQIKPI